MSSCELVLTRVVPSTTDGGPCKSRPRRPTPISRRLESAWPVQRRMSTREVLRMLHGHHGHPMADLLLGPQSDVPVLLLNADWETPGRHRHLQSALAARQVSLRRSMGVLLGLTSHPAARYPASTGRKSVECLFY